MIHMPHSMTCVRDARTMLERLGTLLDQDGLEFAASVVQIARLATTLDELEQTVTSLYQLGLEQHHPFLPDHADAILQWVEQARRSGITRLDADEAPTSSA